MDEKTIYEACKIELRRLFSTCWCNSFLLGLNRSAYPAIRRRPVCFDSSQPPKLCMTLGKTLYVIGQDLLESRRKTKGMAHATKRVSKNQ